jgi:hypothetical protein
MLSSGPQWHDEERFRLLLRRGATPVHKKDHYVLAATIAAGEGDEVTFKLLLDAMGHRNGTDRNIRGAVSEAVLSSNVHIVKLGA